MPVMKKNYLKGLDWREDIFCEQLLENQDIYKWEGVRTQRYKYACYFEQDPKYEFLHDLKKEPTELYNLVSAPIYKDALKQMRVKVKRYAKKYSPKISVET